MARNTAAKPTRSASRKPAAPTLPAFLTLNGLAKALGLTPQRVCALAKDEIITKPDARGYYPASCVTQYCQYIRQRQQRGTLSKVVEEGQRIRNALNEAKLRLLKYEEDLRDGQLITVAARDFDYAVVREHVLSWAGLLPDELEGRDKFQMRMIIDDRARQVLTELSDKGHPNVLETFNRYYAELVAEAQAQQQGGPQEPAGGEDDARPANGVGDGR